MGSLNEGKEKRGRREGGEGKEGNIAFGFDVNKGKLVVR